MRELMSGRGERDLVPGHLRLYRTWRLATDPPLPLRFTKPSVIGATMVPLDDVTVSLMSSSWSVIWSSEMTAECMRRHPSEDTLYVLGEGGVTRPHGSAPEAGCSCGVYGWYGPRDTRMVVAPVIGAIDAWGRCVLGSNGAKVEHARLLAIAPNPFFAAVPVYKRDLDLALGRMSDEGYCVYPSYDALLEDLSPVSVTALAGDPVPLGQMLDAQESIVGIASAGASASQAIEHLGSAIASGIAASVAPLLATRRLPWWIRIGMHAQGICAALLYCAAAFELAHRWWTGAASSLFWGTYSFIAWRLRESLPWRWFRGRGARRA